ncbi:MAG: hypothetical protein P1V97_19660 [Planctomycetota bacterium]|nr:hypothetical protein [Planctomycetota bacterium]
MDATNNSLDRVECPQCAELIKPKAKICRFCRYQMPAAAPKSSPAQPVAKIAPRPAPALKPQPVPTPQPVPKSQAVPKTQVVPATQPVLQAQLAPTPQAATLAKPVVAQLAPASSPRPSTQPRNTNGQAVGGLVLPDTLELAPAKQTAPVRRPQTQQGAQAPQVKLSPDPVFEQEAENKTPVFVAAGAGVSVLLIVMLYLIFGGGKNSAVDLTGEAQLIRWQADANDGDTAAMRALGDYYWTRDPESRDPEKAKKWYGKVKAGGGSEAEFASVFLDQINAFQEKAEAEKLQQKKEAEAVRRRAAEAEKKAKEELARKASAEKSKRLEPVVRQLKQVLATAGQSKDAYKAAVKTIESIERKYSKSDVEVMLTATKSKMVRLRKVALKTELNTLQSMWKTGEADKVLAQFKELEQVFGQDNELQTTLERFQKMVELEKAALALKVSREQAKKIEAAKLAKSGEEEKQRAARLSSIKTGVRRAALKWLKARASRKILCKTCKGSKQKKCASCSGKGVKRAHSVTGGQKTMCDTCNGTGKQDCTSGIEGYRKVELTNVFWKYLSPDAKKRTDRDGLLSSIVAGTPLYNPGVSLVVESSAIREIVVGEKIIEITAHVKWDESVYRWYSRYRQWTNGRQIWVPTVPARGLYKTRWIKKGYKYYLSVGLNEGDQL